MSKTDKKSPRALALILGGLISIAVASFWKLNPEDSKVVRANPRQKIKLKTPEPIKVVKTPIAAPVQEIKIAPMQKVVGQRAIPKDHVEFELTGNNIAIAFGDVILGRLESERKGDRGLFKPPKSRLWSSNIIPFVIKAGTPQTQQIIDALKYFNDFTSVQFILRTDEPEGIVFEGWAEKRCASYVGTVGGLQPIFIGPDCGTQDVLHELMHALGFVHEQSRTDRDKYVRILWDNILPGFANQFDMVPDSFIHNYTGSVFYFDYESIMLYRPESFAKTSGLKTLEPIGSGKISPTTQGLSVRDLERLHYLYGS